jgi:hypothetical protein
MFCAPSPNLSITVLYRSSTCQREPRSPPQNKNSHETCVDVFPFNRVKHYIYPYLALLQGYLYRAGNSLYHVPSNDVLPPERRSENSTISYLGRHRRRVIGFSSGSAKRDGASRKFVSLEEFGLLHLFQNLVQELKGWIKLIWSLELEKLVCMFREAIPSCHFGSFIFSRSLVLEIFKSTSSF